MYVLVQREIIRFIWSKNGFSLSSGGDDFLMYIREKYCVDKYCITVNSTCGYIDFILCNKSG